MRDTDKGGTPTIPARAIVLAPYLPSAPVPSGMQARPLTREDLELLARETTASRSIFPNARLLP